MADEIYENQNREITLDEGLNFLDSMKDSSDPENPDTPPEETPDKDKWTYKDIENFYDRVRMTLNATSDVRLPDSYIDFPEKAPFAEATIKARIPMWKELNDEQFLIFESLIVYQTAALLVSYIASMTVKKKQIPTITLEYNDSNMFDVNGMNLSDYIDYLVAQLNGNSVGSSFIGFRVTDGTPCCCNRYGLL